jgi:hypothetical protein
MENNNQNNNIYKNIANSSGGKLNAESIKHAAQSGNTDALIKNLSDSDKQKLNAILKDKDALEKLLKSPQAAALIKMLSKGKKNG